MDVWRSSPPLALPAHVRALWWERFGRTPSPWRWPTMTDTGPPPNKLGLPRNAGSRSLICAGASGRSASASPE
jgi:hypothetical protein